LLKLLFCVIFISFTFIISRGQQLANSFFQISLHFAPGPLGGATATRPLQKAASGSDLRPLVPCQLGGASARRPVEQATSDPGLRLPVPRPSGGASATHTLEHTALVADPSPNASIADSSPEVFDYGNPPDALVGLRVVSRQHWSPSPPPIFGNSYCTVLFCNCCIEKIFTGRNGD
jgi:hypothetical protein